MRIFHDVEGRDWSLDLNITAAKPLAAWCSNQDPKVDLFDASSFLAATGSIIFTVDVLAILTADQRDARGMTPEDFGRALKGASAYEAQRALLDEYADFFPDPAMAGIIKRSLSRLLESSKREERIVSAAVEAAIKAREERLAILEKSLDGGSSSSQDSPDAEGSEPTTAGSPTGSSTSSSKRVTGRSGKGSPPLPTTRTRTSARPRRTR